MGERGTQAKGCGRGASRDPQCQSADPDQLAVPACGSSVNWMWHTAIPSDAWLGGRPGALLDAYWLLPQ